MVAFLRTPKLAQIFKRWKSSPILASDYILGYSLKQVFVLSDRDFDKAPLCNIAYHDRSRILSLAKRFDPTQPAFIDDPWDLIPNERPIVKAVSQNSRRVIRSHRGRYAINRTPTPPPFDEIDGWDTPSPPLTPPPTYHHKPHNQYTSSHLMTQGSQLLRPKTKLTTVSKNSKLPHPQSTEHAIRSHSDRYAINRTPTPPPPDEIDGWYGPPTPPHNQNPFSLLRPKTKSTAMSKNSKLLHPQSTDRGWDTPSPPPSPSPTHHHRPHNQYPPSHRIALGSRLLRPKTKSTAVSKNSKKPHPQSTELVIRSPWEPKHRAFYEGTEFGVEGDKNCRRIVIDGSNVARDHGKVAEIKRKVNAVKFYYNLVF